MRKSVKFVLRFLLCMVFIFNCHIVNAYVGNADGYMQVNSDGNRQYYGRDGSYQGRSMNNGGTTYYYDNTGKMSGRSQNIGNTTYYYDANGSMAGSSR